MSRLFIGLVAALVACGVAFTAVGCDDRQASSERVTHSHQALGGGPFSSPPWDTNAPPACTTDAQCEYAATFPACGALPGTVRGHCQGGSGDNGVCVDGVAKGCSAARGCDECNVTCTCDEPDPPDAGGGGGDAGQGDGGGGPTCGDSVCDTGDGEDCSSCSADCGTCGQCSPGQKYCASEGICKKVNACPNPGAFPYGGFECCYQIDPMLGTCYLYLPPQNVYTCGPATCSQCKERLPLCGANSECDDGDDTTVDRCDFTQRGGYCTHATLTEVTPPPSACATCDAKSMVRVSALGQGVVNVTGPGIDVACRSDVCIIPVDPDVPLTLTAGQDACKPTGKGVWSGACSSDPCIVTAKDRAVVEVQVTF